MSKLRLLVFVTLLVMRAVAASGQVALTATKHVDQSQHTGPHTYEGMPLTLQAALNEALATNPVLVAARLDFEASRRRRAQEGFLSAPTLEAQIWQWPVDSINPLNTNMYMFTATQEIPGKGKRALRAAAADKDVERSAIDIAVRALEVLNAVKRAYAVLFINRQAVVIHLANVDLLRQTADLTTARYGAGRGKQQEVLKTVLEISKLHGDLVMLHERVALATVELNTLLNRPAGSSIGELTAIVDTAPLPPAADLQRRALDAHPELRGARVDIERAEAALAVANRDYKPDFMVGGGYQLMPRSVGAWTATVGMTWPNAPWARGRLDAAKAQAVADLAAAKAKQQVVANSIAKAVQYAYIRVIAAGERASLLRTSVIPQSQQMLEAARIAYVADRGDAAALVEDQRMLLDAQLEYYRALSDRQQARTDLERAIGADLPPAVGPAAQEAR